MQTAYSCTVKKERNKFKQDLIVCLQAKQIHRWCCKWLALPPILSHHDKKTTYWYVWMLFINYSSAFNIILSCQLVIKLRVINFSLSLCEWIWDILTGRAQVAGLGNIASSTLTLSAGAPQECVSPVPYCAACSLTHDRTAQPPTAVTQSSSLQTTAIISCIINSDGFGLQGRGGGSDVTGQWQHCAETSVESSISPRLSYQQWRTSTISTVREKSSGYLMILATVSSLFW